MRPALCRPFLARWSIPCLQRRALLTTSYVKGPSEPALLDQTVAQHFASIVSSYGDRPAVISRHQNERYTYDELDRKSNALARGLQKKGVRKGDRVAVSLGNNVEFATTTYALFKLGAILVPLNPAFNSTQIIAALSHLSASHLIIGAKTHISRKDPRDNVSLLQEMIPDLKSIKLESELLPNLRHITIVDNSGGEDDDRQSRALGRYEDVLEDGGPGRGLDPQGLLPNEVVNIQFTSGTTSMPKAACLTHQSILNNGKSIGDRMLLTHEDVVCCPPPLFHCFGCILGYMATATHASSIVFPAETFNPLATLKAVQDYRCTALYGVPTMFLVELELLRNGTVSRDGFQYLRTGIAAGSNIPAELMRKLHRELNLTELTICYGMTETSPVSAMTTTDDPLERRIDSVGRLMPHVEAKIVSPTNRAHILPVNTRGELVVSGYLVMKGYWDDAARTAEVMVTDDDGKTWMHTGDEALLSPDGYIHITGRIKDLIIRGGENIHPLEIENCVLAHPGVRDVSVVGVPDERYGECVAAFVVPAVEMGDEREKNGSMEEERRFGREIREWVQDRLSHHLLPKYVFLTPSYPKTASGKIQKFKLREEAIRRVKEGQRL